MPHRIPYLIAYDITNTRTQARTPHPPGLRHRRPTILLPLLADRRLLYTLPPQLDPATDRLHIFRINEQTETRLLGKAKTALAADAPLLII